MTDPRAEQKRAAAEAAVALVSDGMAVGLGTGSTAWFAIEALAARVRAGLSIVGIPTSERSGAQASAGGIRLTSFAERQRLFDLPRSSWADYDTTLISFGGGVWPRSAKSVPVSAQARAALGLELGRPLSRRHAGL